MADFNSFVQLELPKRPFVDTDGIVGQILVRSNNPLAVRELVWSNALVELQNTVNALPTFSNLDPNNVVVTDSTGQITSSAVTVTELDYLSGVTDNIQIQLNTKSAIGHTHNISDITGFDGIDGGDSESVFL